MSCIPARRVLVLTLVLCAGNGLVRASDSTTVEVVIPGADGQRSVDAPLFEAWRQWLIDNGFGVDRCGQDAEHGVFALELEDDTQRDALLEQGFTIQEYSGEPLEGDVRTQSQYFDPDEIAQMLTDISNAHPTITRLFAVGVTFEGRPIFALEISDQPGVVEDEPAIQFNGQHHAREVATSHVPMDVATTLVNGYGVDSEITDWVNNYKTVCVPMVNPDGVQFVFNGTSSWRKNRSNNGCVGVDLNRNYPYLWGPGCGGSSGVCSDLNYRGPSAASEYETQAMIALQNEWHFVMATSYHSFGQFIDYPYACYNGNPAGQMPEHGVIAQMMIGVRDAIDVTGPTYSANTSASAGPLTGDDTSWYYAYKGCYAFIIEIGTSFEPTWTSVPPMIAYLRDGWKYLYRRLGQARLDVYVTEACTGEPLAADVTLTNYVYDTGELARTTFMPFGRWTYMVQPNATYTVRVSKAGYITQDVPIFVANAPVPLTIELVSAAPPVFGDADCDGDVDDADWAVMNPCLTGPGISPAGDCKSFDSESDSDVDLADAAAFQAASTG